MRHRLLGFRVPQVAAHFAAGNGLESHRRDELARARGEHHLHFGALLAQATDEVGALVSRDAAGDAEKYPFALHGPALSAGAPKVCQSLWFRR